MITNYNRLEEYKKEIKAKYELEKTAIYSSFLLQPSRAQLRKLCIERFKENKKTDDLLSFNLFFGFEFSSDNLNKLKAQTDKFRPIETFLKGETDLMDLEGINLAAILVDFNRRPFTKYCKTESETYLIEKVEKNLDSEMTTKNGPKNKLKKKIGIGMLCLFGLFSTSYIGKNFIASSYKCMQWTGDQYELVDCENEKKGIGSFYEVKPYDANTFELKRIEISDTTTFFKYGKPQVWYHKMNNEIEYFNTDGKHPVTSKDLKPITKYMIKTHLKNIKRHK
ncbi:hypothetical protein [Flavobacterium sp.]|uniref:hypothetical protein n=1 Tax=Flavobacterium sp. TaxID=239 RepID=UPI003752DCD1